MKASEREAGEPGLTASTAGGAVTVALLAALCFPLVTTAVASAPALYAAGIRALVAGVVVLVIAVALRRPRPHGRQWSVVGGIGISWTALGFTGMFLSGGRIGPGLATVLASTQPLIAAVIGHFALRERLGVRGTTGMAVAFAGTAIAMWSSDGTTATTLAGAGFVLLGAIGIAIGNVVTKRFADELDPLATTAWQLIIGAGLLLAVAWTTAPVSAIRWTASFGVAIIGLAIPGTAISFVLWFALLRRAPLHAVNAFNFITPVFGLAIGIAFYGERLGLVELAGEVLVVGGAFLAARSARPNGVARELQPRVSSS